VGISSVVVGRLFVSFVSFVALDSCLSSFSSLTVLFFSTSVAEGVCFARSCSSSFQESNLKVLFARRAALISALLIFPACEALVSCRVVGSALIEWLSTGETIFLVRTGDGDFLE